MRQPNESTEREPASSRDSVVSGALEFEEFEDVKEGVLLLKGEGHILFMNQPARKAFRTLGFGKPSHLKELPPQVQAAVLATGTDVVRDGVALDGLPEGIWGFKLPIKELDPEWFRGIVEAEQLAAVGQLAATVAQEIGGPNTSIQVAVDHLLEGSLGQGEKERESLRRVLTQTERISKLTRQLIALADPGKARLVSLDANEIAQSACDLMESSFAAREIELRSDLHGGGLPALADRNHLLQALVNLLLNARTALQGWTGDRIVRVRTELNGERVYLHVEDSGPGIPPEDSSRIFLPFVSTTGGTGMGLFLTRQILVEQRGGIRVGPSSDLGGATFTLYLEKATDER